VPGTTTQLHLQHLSGRPLDVLAMSCPCIGHCSVRRNQQSSVPRRSASRLADFVIRSLSKASAIDPLDGRKRPPVYLSRGAQFLTVHNRC